MIKMTYNDGKTKLLKNYKILIFNAARAIKTIVSVK